MDNNISDKQSQPILEGPAQEAPIHKEASPVRFVYDVSSGTKQLSHSAAIPNAVHYTPFHSQLDPEVIASFEGLVCDHCGSYLNQFCQAKEGEKLWVCCICKTQNHTAQKINKTILDNPTYDVFAQSTANREKKRQKLYLFLIDLCVSEKQMKAIKEALLAFVKAKSAEHYDGVNLISKIGLITFGKFVYCYELSSQLNTVVSVDASINYDMESFYKFLGLKPEETQEASSKYFINIKTGLTRLEKRIKQIKAEGEVQNDKDPLHRCRARRAYGQAINLALNICENLHTQCRVVSLIGGPCTHGVGMTIGVSYKQQLRSIKDYESNENVHYFQSASKFYRSLKERTQGKRIVTDLFVFSVEETGLTEMYDLVRATGGLLVLGEQFSGQLQIFQKSFAKAYIETEGNDMACSLASECFIAVSCSGDIKINGALGSCRPIQSPKGKNFVSEKVIGYGDTNVWAICGMSCYRTLTFIYDLCVQKPFDSEYYIQFKTSYRDYWGFKKIRITTAKRHWDTNHESIAQSFDQEAAIVAVARWYLYRSEFQPKTNLRLWLDKMLVRWTANFASYIKGDLQSFTLPQKMKFLPQFFYHFRRNPIIRRTGLSLDELTYHTHALNTETVEHCLTIIQPALLSYTIEKPFPSAVRLEEEQMKNEAILLLDTYFFVIIWYGENIVYWEKEQFHKQKQYQHVKALLQAPYDDIQYLLTSRFPYPGYYKTSTGSSKERILKSKISPIASEIQSENVISDQKSSFAFMKALVDIIVNGKAS